jgi:hypothetical protein
MSDMLKKMMKKKANAQIEEINEESDYSEEEADSM